MTLLKIADFVKMTGGAILKKITDIFRVRGMGVGE